MFYRLEISLVLTVEFIEFLRIASIFTLEMKISVIIVRNDTTVTNGVCGCYTFLSDCK